MPLYAYKCKVNDHEFEVRQKFSDDPLTVCPECGEEVRRVIGGSVGIVFKGSGFYVTDNKGKKTATLNGSADGKSKDSDGGDGGKTSAKAESTTETKAEAKPKVEKKAKPAE